MFTILFKLYNLSVHTPDSFLYIQLHIYVILANISSILFKISMHQSLIILHVVVSMSTRDNTKR